MKHFFVSIAMVLLGIVVTAQPTWKNISDTRYVSKIVPDGDKLWLCSEGGLMCINHSTNDTTFYNHANSGMPFTRVYDMCLDKQGRLWLTSGLLGIACKDGDNWISYNTTNSNLPNNKSFSIACDTSGNIWACISDNLVKFNGNSWTAYDLSFVNPASEYSFMSVDKNNRILFNRNGLWAFDGTSFVNYTSTNSPLHSNTINALKTFPDGKTWIGHANGLTITDFTNWETYDTLLPGKALNSVNAFDRTPDGKFWLGNYNGDLYFNDGNSWNLTYAQAPVDSIKYIQYLAVDNGNNLFISAWQSAMFDGNYWYKMNTAESNFKGNHIKDIIHTSDNSTWIANSYGLSRIIGNNITNFHHDDSSINTNYYISANGLAEDINGKLYATHHEGISYFENNSWHRKQIPVNNNLFSSLTPDHIAFDLNNNMIIAQFPGIIKYDGNSCQYYSMYLNNFPATEVFCLTRAQNGHVYAGIKNAYVEWNGSSLINHPLPETQYVENKVWDIKVNQNSIWLATTGGLLKYDGVNWEVFSPDNSPLPDYFVSAVDCDESGTVWLMNGITTLIKFDGQTWEIFNHNNSGMIYGNNRTLRIDKLRNIWIGGMNCGISIYNKNGIFLDSHPNKISDNQILKSIYPNPATNNVNISYTLPLNTSNWNLIITDQLGKVVDRIYIPEKLSTYQYPTSKLTNGQYIFSITNSNQVISSKKVIIVK